MNRRAFLALPVLGIAGCTLHTNLPSLGTVPPFRLTSSDGESFDSQELRGKVWVADFIFTTCHGPCPRMTSQMHRIQEATKDFDDVRLVSFTVDPQHDSPAVLAAYAKTFQADASRWFFLTGEAQALNKVSYDSFHLSSVGGPVEHSTRFALVDRRGQIRGYYDLNIPDTLSELISDVGKLRKEVI